MGAVKLAVITLFGLLVAAIAVHIKTVGISSSTQILYPLEAKISLKTIRCTSRQPLLLSITRYLVEEYGLLSVQVAYSKEAGEIESCWAGWQFWPVHGVQENSRFRIASLTKLITAAVIADLVSTGVISWETTLGDIYSSYLPFNDPRLEDVTLRQLITHRAGFDRLVSGDAIMGAVEPWCPFSMERLKTEILDFYPGSKTAYSNLGYCILGEVVREVTGVSFREHVEKKFFDKYATFGFAAPELAVGEVKPDLRFENGYNYSYLKQLNYQSIASSAGMLSSANDFVNFLIEIVGEGEGSLLDEANLGDCEMYRKYSCYGNAFYHLRYRGDSARYYIHGGYLPGSTALTIVDQKRNIITILGAGKSIGVIGGKERLIDFLVHNLREG